MIFTETPLKGAYIIDVKRLEDDRGFYGRSYCQKEFQEKGLNTNVVQTNVSYSIKKGTLRGLHLQLAPNEETKLVRCMHGAIYDVMVDMRKTSPTYKKWFGAELTADNFRMMYVPEGFAHGFLTLEDHTSVTYQVTQFYTPGYEIGFRWDDPAFNIQWPFVPEVISAKDRMHAFLESESFHLNLK